MSNFSDVSDAILLDTVNAGNFSYSVQNLERDTTYWFAVVAVDLLDNADDQVTAVSGTAIDKIAPQDVTGLKAQSIGDTLTFSWDHSANSDHDLAGYRAYFADDTEGVSLQPDQNRYSIDDLDSATEYQLHVTAVDNDGNESSGVSVSGITLLDNPAVTTISPRAGGVKLFWDAAEPSEYVKQYRLYMSESEFSSVEGMIPKVTTTSLSTALTDLTSGVSYYFAVTVVNISDGEQNVVNIVSASPITGTNVSGEITQNTNWTMAGSPYIVAGDITIRNAGYSHDSSPAAATLTIEPGVQIRFEPGTGLYVGKDHYYASYSYFGALSVQGTSESPVIFTSNKTSPDPGDWKGIYFRDGTLDSGTVLEHCLVEYGGRTNNADIYLENAKPTIQYNTIRNSSHSGIYVNGTGANGATLRCNNLKDNHYGVYAVNKAAPVIHDNNFLRNKNYGVNNTGPTTVDATDNWWNDANGAVRVPVIAEGQPIAVTLSWAGGDPNPWDTVTYDVYFGTAEDSLVIVAEGIETASYEKAALAEGTTYYWKIVSRDNGVGRLETAGPVWHFTTLGVPPDLIISNVTWNPASDLQAGQSITFTATVENSGSGPVVDAFKVELYVDGSNIGSKTVNPVMPENTSLPLSFTWTAVTGSHTIEARADSQNQVVELYEENNSRTVDLPDVKDPTPPELIGMVPANGVSLKQVDAIVFILNDQYGVVDDAAVIAGVVVLNGDNQPVGGTVSEASDRFTFTPSTVPLADDTYAVSLTARDLAGNTKDYNFSFTVDGQPPAEPTITGGAVLSGLIQVRPVQNRSKTATVILTGIREDNTAVYVNNQEKINTGSGNWSASLSLAQGDNALEIRLQDAAGNRSPSVWVDILVDSIAPAISGVTPADNSFINTAPSAVTVTFTEATSGLILAESLLSVKDRNQ